MSTPILVKCPECGAQLKLKSCASLEKRKSCPKCEVPFTLSEEESPETYDLDARDAEPAMLPRRSNVSMKDDSPEKSARKSGK